MYCVVDLLSFFFLAPLLLLLESHLQGAYMIWVACFFSANFEDCVALALGYWFGVKDFAFWDWWCFGLLWCMFWCLQKLPDTLKNLVRLRERKSVGKRYADNRRKASRDFCNKPAYA
jgi:hypothetical protein